MPHLDLRRPDHAYFFGFAQTDGSHYAGTGQRGRLTIELSKRDEAVLQSFTILFDVYSRVSYRQRTTNFGAHHAATWTVCDLAFRRELVELGLPTGQKSETVAPPSTAFSVQDYVRGLVDGDGSVGFTRTGRPFVGFVTASQPLAEFFCAQALSAVGAHRTPNRNARDRVYNLVVAGDPAASFSAWLIPMGASRSSGSGRPQRAWPHGRGRRTCEHDL